MQINVEKEITIFNQYIQALNTHKAVLNPSTISALPVLASLQRWLAELSISPPPAAKPSLVLEVVVYSRLV